MSPLLMPLAVVLAAQNPAPVPGALNPAVTQDSIATTICVPNWTATIRPPRAYTSRLKRKQMAVLHIPGSPRLYEEDHFVPLSLGGHPTDPANLWPQRWIGSRGAHKKDRLEQLLHRMVCRNQITLVEAQTAIRTDWVAAYKRYLP